MQILGRESDYALRCLVKLAGADEGAVLSARQIASEDDLPEPLLRKILQKLVKAGIVESVRGSQGGFRLGGLPEQTTVLSVVETLQGPVAINRCYLGRAACPRRPKCRLSPKLAQAQQMLEDTLRQVTIGDLVEETAAAQDGHP